MKKLVVLFPRDTYASGSDGTLRIYVSADANRLTFGAAKSIRFQAVGFRRSTNARIRVKMWETCAPDLRPNELIPGGTPFFTSANVTTLRPAPETISGVFSGNVNFTLEVEASAGAALEEWDGAVYATLILEE